MSLLKWTADHGLSGGELNRLLLNKPQSLSFEWQYLKSLRVKDVDSASSGISAIPIQTDTSIKSFYKLMLLILRLHSSTLLSTTCYYLLKPYLLKEGLNLCLPFIRFQNRAA